MFRITSTVFTTRQCRVSDECRTQGRMARRVNISLYVVKSTGFEALPANSNPVCFRMEAHLLPSVNPHSLLDGSVSGWKRSFFGASKLLIQDSHRINFPFSSLFTCPCSSVVFHVLITFLYSRPDACRVSGVCRAKDECPQREYYVM